VIVQKSARCGESKIVSTHCGDNERTNVIKNKRENISNSKFRYGDRFRKPISSQSFNVPCAFGRELIAAAIAYCPERYMRGRD